jgi:TonB-dependent receptor
MGQRYGLISGIHALLALTLVGMVAMFPLVAAAQGTGTVKGRVMDKTTGDVLPGANVVVEGTSIGAATGLDGGFVLYGVPAGDRQVKISYVGYASMTANVTLRADQTIEQVFKLVAQAIEGEAVIVTAQALGQNAAINQQLSSNTIANVVAADRIKEIPDVNAAESIGRLPGVSINRSGGEANNVTIRGLAAKYNLVTVNGTRVPSSGDDRGSSILSSVVNNASPDARYGGNDRSVDLGLISSTSLEGIELKKAITPDMDADVFGGTIDLKVKEAPEGFHFGGSVQGGYNKLQNYYGNYNVSLNVSNRFLDDALGVIVVANTDNYDRSADKFTGNWDRDYVIGTQYREKVTSINLREESSRRKRSGGNLLLDYVIPNGKVNANLFFTQLKSTGTYRVNDMNPTSGRHYYDIEDRHGITSVFTGSVSVKQDYDWVRFDAGISRTGSRGRNPNERGWHFSQETGIVYMNIPSKIYDARDIAQYARIDSIDTRLADAYQFDTWRDENQSSVQINVTFPLTVGESVSGYLKAGGKIRGLNRMNDEEVHGISGVQYGGGVVQATSIVRSLSQLYPGDWDYLRDSANIRGIWRGGLPVQLFLSNYSRSNFLNGEYPLGFAMDIDKLQHIMQAMQLSSDTYQRYMIQSLGRDYDGVEHFQAGYLMGEFNIANLFTVIPGVRWEKDNSRYNGERYRAVITGGNTQGPPLDYTVLTTERSHEYWLPIVHLIVTPLDWLKIRLARTETLTRPDYRQYAPITYISANQDRIVANNSALRPARSVNLDLSASVFDNTIGLLTVSGFHKRISDLVISSGYNMAPGIPPPPGSNIPASWLAANAPIWSYDENNPYPAYVKGIELEWQTHFWYLPSVFQGLVFNINYSRIFSEVDWHYTITRRYQTRIAPPAFGYKIVDSSRTMRVPNQPSRILNLTLGYDYGGFSTRLSYLFQSDALTGYSTQDDTRDTYSGNYSRWDLSVQQSIFDWGLQLFANFSNLNGQPDRSFIGSAQLNPTFIEYYGFTMDVGFRFRL